jgi:ribosomal protein S18 acetylase RimI-like enzyme
VSPSGVALGSCLCGRVRYRVHGPFGLTEHCHCSRCRKWHGAEFGTTAEISAGALELLSGADELRGWRSSPARERVFCARCGAKLWIRRLDTPETLALCAAPLDESARLLPARHVFTADAVPWRAESDSLPRFTVYPGWELELRPARESDLDFVLALEQHPETAPYIGHWSRAEYAAAIASPERELWLAARRCDGAPAGFVLAFDLRAQGFDVYVKRIAIADKSRGLGREALGRFAQHAFAELGAKCVWLTVFGSNERAQRSYRALGFEVERVTPERRAELSGAAGGFSDESLVMALLPERLRT